MDYCNLMDTILNRRVLVLNQNYQPFTLTKTKRAISLVLMEKVEIIEYYNLYYDLMNFWNKELPNFIYNIKYDEIINDTKNKRRKVFAVGTSCVRALETVAVNAV